MRKLLVLAFFLVSTIGLFSQTFRETRIYVPRVAGIGREGDNTYFYKQLTYEIVLQYHALVRYQHSCDYIMKAAIEPYTGQFLDGDPVDDDNYGPVPSNPIPRIKNSSVRREYFSWEVDGELHFYDSSGEGNYEQENPPPAPLEEAEETVYPDDGLEFVLTIELIDKQEQPIGKQYIIYSVADAAVNRLISIVVYNMLAGIPEIEVYDYRERWFFLDASVLWTPRIYNGDHQSINLQNFGFRFSGEFHFADAMSLGFGIQFVQDHFVISEGGDEYTDMILELPLFLKFVFRASNRLTLEPFVGVGTSFSVYGKTEPSFLSGLAGFQVGLKAGTGMIILDQQFSMDLLSSEVGTGTKTEYHRYILQFGIGYKQGFYPKRRRIREY